MEQKLLEMLLGEMSVSGEERVLQEKLMDFMAETADEAEMDRVGNGFYTVRGNSGKRILLAAHIDEIGLMVTGATSDGFLKVTKAGGINARTYPGHGVKIRTAQGILYGSVVMDSGNFKKEDFSAKDILVDIGASTKEEALSAVQIGDRAVPDAEARKLSFGRLMARGLDDRSGVYTIMEALRRVKEAGSPHTVTAAATVGEEVGQHGANWVAGQTCPDEAIIVDVTYTSDYDGMRSAEWGEIALGKGPALCINPICDKQMNAELMAVAKEHDIPYQVEVSGGRSCTDADEIHISGKGVPVALVSIPLRYMHTPAEVADEKDLENTIRLLCAYLQR